MVSAIIVAAGKGVRMKGRIRKQYLDLSGRPVLGHSAMTFDACSLIDEIFIVVPKDEIDYCQKNIVSLLELKTRVNLIPGGDQRQDSVYNGLQAIDKKTTTVVIHDGVRPFIHPENLTACIFGAKDFGACILAVPVADTLKRVNKSGIVDRTLFRENIWLAQTPQAFQYGLILKAHETARRDGYAGTDDASLVERLGKDVRIINGSKFNIKITTQEDLDVARAMFDIDAVSRPSGM
ncbi:MAG: 2-C-methyl-D-erythritol 4-phosphate cytidylyltransferase [Deltaproteobacteria bacterium]|nr:2-C-methyl-D-erythritol 4-phosphate cytidylyltransferase [Deltaproteobacteria bacterium]